MNQNTSHYQPKNKIRFVTATSLFDGHDASINIMRRILQSLGAEVIHLGHNRSVKEIIAAIEQEDAHAVAISSYQGGHVEYFQYIIDSLREKGLSHVKVFGGGGGVIVPSEIEQLEGYGVEKIYSPEDGQKLGLIGMVADMLERADQDFSSSFPENVAQLSDKLFSWSRTITAIEHGTYPEQYLQAIQELSEQQTSTPVIGLTGTGGAGKSSLTDEIIRCFKHDNPHLKIAVIAIDPSKRKTGGALLGDRIRMNTLDEQTAFRSMATRDTGQEVTSCLSEVIHATKAAEFDLIIVETSGIGQGDAGIVPFVDCPIYVMTPEYGAASQLEKIDMLDFAQIVVINKFERRGAKDAFRDVAKQYQRNHNRFQEPPESMPVFGTVASRFNDDGVRALYHGILAHLNQLKKGEWQTLFEKPELKHSSDITPIIPSKSIRYCAEIAETVRSYHEHVEQEVSLAREIQHLTTTQALLGNSHADSIESLIDERKEKQSTDCQALLNDWPEIFDAYQQDELSIQVRDKTLVNTLKYETLSGLKLNKVALPKYQDHGEQLKWLMKENRPGHFPFTAGVFPFKREGEDPTRMFAGEGDAFKTNQRFKLLSKDSEAKRLSTAFDSVTLYGFDPNKRPDIYGKVGNAGVSIATLDDMKVLYDGFDLCDPKTSVSMTINGPAPTILAMFLNTAIAQKIEQYKQENGEDLSDEQLSKIKAEALQQVRGTVQADILKEDQGQNTCIFSTEFSLRMMADIQEYFVQQQVRNFYSVSISGYHIAEAGANPISQLAFTLANGFTYVEAYLARGMAIDDFAPNFSFFFSNGMDPEYSVMGRVARRIWAIALKNKYGANERSQKLKYHIQTSGRSLHAQEFQFNDIRTTLEALIAIYDNCNSLHTNAFDEAITTPTDESVRRALAIQMIINQEWGLAKNQNSNQGSFIIEELTDLVEEAVLQMLESIDERGGVLGAMETGFQRGRIQEESLHYEHKKHDGSLPLIGVNTFINPDANASILPEMELSRSSTEEKERQLQRLNEFHSQHTGEASVWLEKLQSATRSHDNVFAVLMEAVNYCSLGQITQALFEVGGQYRRNM